jgi:hypothetical protein
MFAVLSNSSPKLFSIAAIVCCCRSQQFSALQFIAVDLNSASDPALVQKCAHFFVQNGQYEKAVNLLAVGKQVGSWARQTSGGAWFVQKCLLFVNFISC